ncbi:pseudouridine synthase [Leuconostoc litchii]|uniref:RNA pseudouridylate synthase n=1 Tax=Leuconostoc litchii TaxID=1981069 RepID=A0A6P2CPT3_9LACO|nr:RluA family pseudouridine synthase [Leuconostoc litchii]TYC46220.1 RluA family pseudouridine synthase [Leuconostoc litchii]GMA69923.1 pseudouridine synthase [Leuconostoc litchii]
MAQWQYNFIILSQNANITIKALLIRWLLPQRLRGALRIKKHLRVNGHIVPTSYVLQVGDCLQLLFEEDDVRTGRSNYVPNDERPVNIVFENSDLVIVNKPAGIKMHPHSPTENDTLLNYLAADFVRRRINGQPYMVHRIDRATSGLVIVAKNPVVVPILDRMLADKKIIRTYLTWVNGTVKNKKGTIKSAIGTHKFDERKRDIDGCNAQAAVTHWWLMHTVFKKSLLRVQLDTGRMHQIRVHLASIGHPIIGDDLYGEQPYQRMLLHSASIKISLPFDGGVKIITGSVPDDFPRQLR